MSCIPEVLREPLRAANEQLRVAFIGEAHTAVELHGTIACEAERIGRLRLRHAAGRLRISIERIVGDDRGRVVDERAGAIHLVQNVHCRMLERLIAADVLTELLPRLQVIDNDVEARCSAARGLRRGEHGAEEAQVAQGRSRPGSVEHVLDGNLRAVEGDAAGALGLIDDHAR